MEAQTQCLSMGITPHGMGFPNPQGVLPMDWDTPVLGEALQTAAPDRGYVPFKGI